MRSVAREWVRSARRLLGPFLLATIIFTGSVIIGVVLAQPSAAGTESSQPTFSLVEILETNLQVLGTLLGGAVLFGIPTVGTLALNGVAFGAILVAIEVSGGIMVLVAAIVPHAIFEIPALLLAAAVGFRVPATVCRRLWNNQWPPLGPPTRKAILIGSAGALVLMLIAAVIEVTVTPGLLGELQ